MFAALQGSARSLNRHDRQVARVNLRIASETSKFSVTCALEEALRLAMLPGEEEGRIYVFNKISLTGLPSHADRSQWTERVQSMLTAVASTAVPGSHPSAATANAVYFNSTEEALETLLVITVRCLSIAAARLTEAPAWFIAAFLALPSSGQMTQPKAHLEALLERIFPPAMPLPVAASLLLSVIDAVGPISLLDAIPEQSLRTWMSHLTAPSSLASSRPEVTPRALSLPQRAMLNDVAAYFGSRSPATVWLAVLLVAVTAPSRSPAEIYRCALASLRDLETSHELRSSLRPTLRLSGWTAPPKVLVTPASPESFNMESSAVDSRPPLVSPLQPQSPQPPSKRLPPPAPALLGEPTRFAGLYFLLHVLRHLGIVAALKDSPELAEADLPALVLRDLAARCRVPLDDPILSPLGVSDPVLALSPEALSGLAPSAYPVLNLQSSSNPVVQRLQPKPPSPVASPGELVTLWTSAVRLWCLRNARIPVRGILLRPGRIWLTRTDLDVTLPLNATDLRIRRAGLDLDPLWLPWFGPTGRVVRFHYGEQGTFGVR